MSCPTRARLEAEVACWRAQAQSAQAVIDQLQVEIAESWRARRAAQDHERRKAIVEGRHGP